MLLVASSIVNTVAGFRNDSCFLDELVEEEVEFSVKTGKTPIGVVAANDPIWCWYIGCLGRVKWVVAQSNIPGWLDDNPPWHHAWDEVSSENAMVKVVLLQGS